MCPWALSDAAEELDVGALDCLRPAPEAMDTDTGPRSVTAQSHIRLREAEALYKALTTLAKRQLEGVAILLGACFDSAQVLRALLSGLLEMCFGLSLRANVLSSSQVATA